MNQYEAPKTDPSNKIHVADAMTVEMTEDVYFTAKLQNRFRWTLVLAVSIGSFFLEQTNMGIGITLSMSFSLGIAIYAILSKTIFPLANLTSTTKFKKFGEQMKMDKMNRKLGIGEYAKKEDK